jgi:hypothetical protein
VASFADLVRGGGVGLALIRIIGLGRFLWIPRVFTRLANIDDSSFLSFASSHVTIVEWNRTSYVVRFWGQTGQMHFEI